MMLNALSKAIAAAVACGAISVVNGVAVTRGNDSSVAYYSGGFPTPVIRPSFDPYSDDPAYNPHLNSPDVDSDELCKRGKTHEDLDANGNGNWYCQKIDQVIYKKVTSHGPYDEVVGMDDKTGRCDFKPREVQGELGPFNEPMSLVFRGPLRLKQFSIYLPNGDGSFRRTGEYHAASQTRKGIMFLGNYGGQGSGTNGFFGASLSYVRPDGLGGASGPSIIHDAQLVSHSEFIVTTDQPCDDSCGYRRPGAVTYKGFGGSARVFMFEFAMPDEPERNQDPDKNGNKPAIWMLNSLQEPAIWLLNSRIPNTAQYYKCNCWNFECGELDLFKILYPGQVKALSAFHLGGEGKSAGDANWLQRPTGGPINDGARFGGSLSASQVEGLKAKSGLVSEYVYPNH
ncbi:putative TOS1-like glycosyl hydrolase-domain-containing protein [Sordaria brevicollis]|uniref:glucan endo-1,3-beta-D-glucosidase n=1 Tax=Sordaria brevicollis TaxID=83679 RepID=A0AAE0PAW0_SORBR|nr:putative TOS1-like glycosyl hydrolase-domain-containing protein [Sordaria brevicollis]